MQRLPQGWLLPECSIFNILNDNNIMEVLKIVVLVKLEDGTVRQVSARDELKHLALKILTADDGELRVSPPIDDILIGEL